MDFDRIVIAVSGVLICALTVLLFFVVVCAFVNGGLR